MAEETITRKVTMEQKEIEWKDDGLYCPVCDAKWLDVSTRITEDDEWDEDEPQLTPCEHLAFEWCDGGGGWEEESIGGNAPDFVNENFMDAFHAACIEKGIPLFNDASINGQYVAELLDYHGLDFLAVLPEEHIECGTICTYYGIINSKKGVGTVTEDRVREIVKEEIAKFCAKLKGAIDSKFVNLM